MSRDPDDEAMIDKLKDWTGASIALSAWFDSQRISPPEAVIVLGILLTGLAETTGLTDRKIDKILHHIRVLTRAAVRAGDKPRRRKR
jgi:hypothetical protein